MEPRGLSSQEMDKHMIFLHQYAVENQIIFRVSRSGITVESLDKPTKTNKMENRDL